MGAKGRSTGFDGPIALPRGGQLVTLEDAGKYITKLPKAEHEAPEWQAGRPLKRTAQPQRLTHPTAGHANSPQLNSAGAAGALVRSSLSIIQGRLNMGDRI
jgi:hypothetical protein